LWVQGGNSLRFARHNQTALLSVLPPHVEEQVENVNLESNPTFYRPTYVSIDLDAIEFNIQEISKLVKPSKVAVAIKANAYGHGIIEVAKKLEQLKVEMLCVATAEEALCLRENGISSQILLLSEPPLAAIGPCYLNDITFTVYTKDCIDSINSYATKERKAKIHLKVETGMNRIGVDVSQALDFARKIKTSENLIFEGLFTHFATAEEPTNPMTAAQLERFEKVLDDVEMAGLTPRYIHAANSAAALRIPSSRFSMVRVGICAYGIYPDARGSDVIELKLALSLKTEVAFLKTIKAGESVSYGARYTADRDTQIATLPIGYGDGVPRNYGLSGGKVLIRGVRCPIVGRVTMDQAMVDVGKLPVSVGDEVTMIGTDGNSTISTTEWGDLTGTISYEILCRLNERLPRIYD